MRLRHLVLEAPPAPTPEPLVYAGHTLTDPPTDRTRPLVGMIDEFKYMARVPWLASFAADAAKTWRTFGAHLWTLDQDAHTYLGADGGVADEAMLSVIQNAPLTTINPADGVLGRCGFAGGRRGSVRVGP